MEKKTPDRDGSSALTVWLQLAALLVGLAAFGLLIYWLASMNRHAG